MIDPDDANIVWNAAALRWEVTFDVTGFSGFFAYGSNSLVPLPVKLLNFTASKITKYNNILNWQTATEDPGTSFEITRSGNGSDFTALGTLTGKGNADSYNFYDNQPLAGNNYYRLRITDARGTTYSNVAIVSNTRGGSGIIVSPIPATNTISITNTDASANGREATVTDMQGRLVFHFLLGAINTIDVRSWPTGVYSLHLSTGAVIRLVKK